MVIPSSPGALFDLVSNQYLAGILTAFIRDYSKCNDYRVLRPVEVIFNRHYSKPQYIRVGGDEYTCTYVQNGLIGRYTAKKS